MKKRGLKSSSKNWIGPAYRSGDLDRYEHGSLVFYLLKSRNVTMANYKSGYLLEDI